MADNELVHFGVRGMKWGVRRAERPAPSTDAQNVTRFKKTVKRGGTNALTTKELQQLVTRMNLEQQYSRLAAKPSKYEVGMKFVNGFLSTTNTINQVMQFTNSPVGKLVKEQLESQMAKKIAGK